MLANYSFFSYEKLLYKGDQIIMLDIFLKMNTPKKMIGQKCVQAGGHHTEERNHYSDDLKYFIKKSVGNERSFYQQVQGTLLAEFVPKFIDDGREQQTILENLMYQQQNPCCIDIKLGRRMYGYGFPLERALKRDQKSEKTTTVQYAMRLTGYLINYPDKQVVSHSSQCKYLSYNEASQTLCNLFRTIKIDIQRFTQQCESLIQILWESNVELFSTSLLIIQDFGKPETLQIKLCDFAYAYTTSDLDKLSDWDDNLQQEDVIKYNKQAASHIQDIIEGIRSVVKVVSSQNISN